MTDKPTNQCEKEFAMNTLGVSEATACTLTCLLAPLFLAEELSRAALTLLLPDLASFFADL